jgi:hypothetical protein
MNQVAGSLKKAVGLLSMVQEGGGKMSASGHDEVAIKTWEANLNEGRRSWQSK